MSSYSRYRKAPDPEMARIGARILAMLKQRGHTRAWLVAQSGVASGAITEICKGQRRNLNDPRLRHTLRKIERALSVQYGTFVPQIRPAAGKTLAAQRLLTERLRHSLSQNDLEALTGVSQTIFSQIENGKEHMLGPKTKAALAQALGAEWWLPPEERGNDGSKHE